MTKGKASAERTAKPHGFKPKLGRPTQEQVVAIEASILLVARTMFISNGYANTSMEAVAAEAGVSKGTLYARYPSKSDLFRAIVTERLAAWQTDIGPAAEELASLNVADVGVAEYLIRLGNAFLQQLERPDISAFDRLVAAEADRFPELAEEFRQQGYLKEIDRLSDLLTAAGAESGWPVADGRGVAIAYTSALMGWHRGEMAGSDSESGRKAFVAKLVAIFVGGRSSW